MKKYRIKLSNDDVWGPFFEDAIRGLIDQGKVKGTDLIQEFPLGEWGYLIDDFKFSPYLKDEATFIKKINLKDLKDDNEVKKDDFQEFKYEKYTTKENEEILKVEDDSKSNSLTKNEDKTKINTQTLEYLKKLKEEKEREELKKKEVENQIILNVEDVSIQEKTSDKTEVISLDSIKNKLLDEAKSVELELKKNEIKSKQEEKIERKIEDGKKISTPQVNKRKKIIYILLALFLIALLFPEENKDTESAIKITNPEIKFPSQYDSIDETKALESYKKGLELYKTFKYEDLIKASTFFLNSVEHKFEDNEAMSKLILVYSLLLEYSKNKIEDANRVFKLVQINNLKRLKDPNLTESIARFYNSVGKPAAAIRVIEEFNLFKGSKPTLELFSIYLEALINFGNIEKAGIIKSKIENIENKSWPVYKSLIQYSFMNEDLETLSRLIEKASALYPDMLDLLVQKGRLAIKEEKFDDLKNTLLKMKKNNCEHNSFYYSKYYEYLAMLQVYEKKFDEAVLSFKKALEFFDSQELRSKLATLNQSTNPEVNTLILESRALDLIAKSRKEASEYKWKEAFNFALNATLLAPNFVEAKLNLAALQIKRSFYKEAINSLEILSKEDPLNFKITFSLLDAYIESYKFSDAKKLISIISTSEDIRTNYKFEALMAKYFLFQNQFDSALLWLKKAIDSNPLDDSLLFQMAKFLLKYRKYEDAKVRLNKCIELDPSKIEYKIAYAEILYESEGTSAAIGYLYDLLKEYPTELKLLSAIGIYYFKSGQIKNFEEIKTTLSKNSKDGKSLFEFLIQASILEDDYKKVIEYSKSLLNIDPADIKAELLLGQIYMEREMYKEALQTFNSIKDRVDSYPKLKYFMSKLYLLTEDLDKAIELAKEEVKINPSSDDGYILLGNIYRQKEDYIEAEKWYKEAQKIDKNNPETMVGIAFISFKKSQFDIAIDLFKKAIKLNPADRMSHKLLGDVYRQIGQSPEAIESYKNFLELAPESKYKDQIESYINMMK